MKKIIGVILVLFVISWLSSCNQESIKQVKKIYKTHTVQSWSLDEIHTVIWYVEWEKTVSLSTKVWWKITEIYVSEWDSVKTWDLLAKLDSEEAKVGYSTSQNLITSLLQMKTSTIEMYDDMIKAMQQKLEQSKLWEKQTQTGLEDTKIIWDKNLQTAKVQVSTAKVNLENTKIVLETKEKHIYDNSKNAITRTVILDTNIIKFVDELLGITPENKEKNNSFDEYLSVKNISYLKEATDKFKQVNKDYLEYKNYYDNIVQWKIPTKEEIIIWLNNWEQLAEDMKRLLDLTYNVIDSSLENVAFTNQMIWSYKTQISNFWVDIESSLITVSWGYMLGLKWTRQSLVDFKKTSSMQIELLEEQLKLAVKNFESYKVTSQAKIREIETWTLVSSSQIIEIKSSIESLRKQKKLKLVEIEAKIKEAEWQKQTSVVWIDSWKIYSSIDWVVLLKKAEQWQVVWWWQTILEVSKNDELVVKIDILEQNYNNIDRNNILLEVDWYHEQIQAKVTKVLPTKDQLSKKIWLEISFDNSLKNIKIWSYTKVIFKNKTKSEIIIPNKAIVSKFMLAWVYVLENNKAVFKNIEILKQDDNSSIIKWLKVWDKIIIDWKENIWDGEEL